MAWPILALLVINNTEFPTHPLSLEHWGVYTLDFVVDTNIHVVFKWFVNQNHNEIPPLIY